MPQIGNMTTKKLVNILAGDDGIAAVAAAMSAQQAVSLPPILAQQIISQNVAAEMSDKSLGSKYPLVYVYCTKVVNQLREKFRTFSGEAQMTVEARVSQDRLEDLETRVHSYVDAITLILDARRGDWGDGVFYSGAYEIAFSGVKHGGSNFIQVAKVSFVLEISTD